MKYFFLTLVLIHGAIHLPGFVKAFKIAPVEQLSSQISKFSGILWLLAFLLFMATVLTFLLKTDSWFILALISITLSSILVIFSWTDAKFGMIPNLVILIVALSAFANHSYYNKYKNETLSHIQQDAGTPANILTEADIQNLPRLVRKYMQYTGCLGKPRVKNFRIEFTGKIRKDEESGWMPFSTEQYNFVEASTRLFFMKAVMKGLPVAGFHSFKNGIAFMDIRLFSIFRVQYQDGEEMGIAETVTFFNDMCCMAPATLIDKRITWLETGNDFVRASFLNNGISVSAVLYFNDTGELINFVSDDRYAAGENNSMQKIRWSTPLKNYKDVDGFRLASSAEAIYSYPEGDFSYGTFSLIHVKYNCTNFR